MTAVEQTDTTDNSTDVEPTIRAANRGDEHAVVELYNWYIANTVITFEEQPLDADAMAERMFNGDASCPWFVLEIEGVLLGYAYAGMWKSRAAYRSSRETSIYLHRDAAGKGYGSLLYRHLLNEMRKTTVHLLIAGIALPNSASVALHESLGFKPVGQFNEVGRKFGQWVDVGYWQLAL